MYAYLFTSIYICLDPRESLQREFSKALLLSLLLLSSNVHRPHDVDIKLRDAGQFLPCFEYYSSEKNKKSEGKGTITQWGQQVEENVKKGTISRAQSQ